MYTEEEELRAEDSVTQFLHAEANIPMSSLVEHLAVMRAKWSLSLAFTSLMTSKVSKYLQSTEPGQESEQLSHPLNSTLIILKWFMDLDVRRRK